MTEALVALSIDGAPSYSWLARRCLESLRRTGTKLDVLVFRPRGARLDVTGIPHVDLVDVDTARHESVYVEKWHRLAHLDVERVIYLDVDTICFRPLELLLDRYVIEDIYARQEAGTRRPGEPADELFPPQIDWAAFDRQREPADASVPVVNTGVMILNHAVCRRIPQFLSDLCTIDADWSCGARPYPSTNVHITEELALSAALGRPGCPTVGRLSPDDAPFYAETRRRPSHPIVMHVWSGLYRQYLHESRAWSDLADYDVQRRRDRLRRLRSRGGRDGVAA